MKHLSLVIPLIFAGIPTLETIAPIPVLAQTEERSIEIVAETELAPGNITVTPDGRIIVSMHQFFNPEYPVMELTDDGKLVPFPNSEFSSLDAVLGIQADANGVVWMLDNGLRSGVPPQIVGWNTQSDSLETTIPLPPDAIASNSFLNDLAVDLTHNTIYIADTTRGGNPALIVVDLATGNARRVLENHASVIAENADMVVEGNLLQQQRPDGSTVNPRIGVNPIALDPDDEWLYYGPMTGTQMYRIPTADLLDETLSDAELEQRVEAYGERPNSDGISVDGAGNVYITDIGENAIGVTRPDGTYQQLVSETWLSWPDAFSFGPDGNLYGVANQLHRTAALNAGEDISDPPFVIFRLQPLAEGVVGR
ncbi:MAG: L-dopachrome tautomerase-related protein [Cyanobacteriota bacterium]|nr:L-dopachrome tautomerase-related protein [Cyanobacteriota bacterium]